MTVCREVLKECSQRTTRRSFPALDSDSSLIFLGRGKTNNRVLHGYGVSEAAKYWTAGDLSDGCAALPIVSSTEQRATWGRRSIVPTAEAPEKTLPSFMHGDEIGRHTADGEGKQAGIRQVVTQQEGAEADAEQLLALRRRAQAEASRREHWCNICGRAFQLTPTEILQHKRSHANG